MKKSEKDKIKELTVDALHKRIEKEEADAFKIMVKLRSGKLKNQREFKNMRKIIAFLKTILREKLIQAKLTVEKK
jgi:ribosomal protein L29